MASARADPKETVAQGGVAEVTLTQTREEVFPPHEGKAHGPDGASVPLVAEAPGVFKAEAMEAGAPKTAETAAAGVGVFATTEATMVEAKAPETVKAMTAEAGAPKIAEANMMAARPPTQEAEMKGTEALAAPLVQGPPLLRESAREAEVYPISFDDTSRVRGVVDAKETGAMEQPAPTLESEAKVIRAAEASNVVQTVLETEIGEHEALKRAALSTCNALEVVGVQSGSSLGSRLVTLSSQMRERL
ncbi:uncharacterized protein [Miscanthus floridulus]|uniref:uncharacterized protein n=1 Tax=Miscanthus floridulus TaxID=154761 RepID=UPI0034585BF2